jgi:hypothetical protein
MTTPLAEYDQPPIWAYPGHGPEIFPARPSTHPGGPAPGPGETVRDAPGPADQLAWLLAAEDDEALVGRVFEDFEERLGELVRRIVAVLEDGRLDFGRLQALHERIAHSVEVLVGLADAVKIDLDRCL